MKLLLTILLLVRIDGSGFSSDVTLCAFNKQVRGVNEDELHLVTRIKFTRAIALVHTPSATALPLTLLLGKLCCLATYMASLRSISCLPDVRWATRW